MRGPAGKGREEAVRRRREMRASTFRRLAFGKGRTGRRGRPQPPPPIPQAKRTPLAAPAARVSKPADEAEGGAFGVRKQRCPGEAMRAPLLNSFAAPAPRTRLSPTPPLHPSSSHVRTRRLKAGEFHHLDGSVGERKNCGRGRRHAVSGPTLSPFPPWCMAAGGGLRPARRARQGFYGG